MVVSLFAQLRSITRDLPMPKLDERYFVTPATYIASSGDLNPHWFGHPGSLVIYPLAFLFRLREILFHGAPITGAAHSVAARLHHDAGSFYLLGRLWVMLLGLLALPLLYLVGRRVFGELPAFVAMAIWAIAPLTVQYGTITRTDTAGLCFALLTILCCLRALDRPSTARFALAGAAGGLAVSSRYFLASLAILIVATWWMSRTPARTRVPFSALVVAGLAMIATFALTTPYFFLDLPTALDSIGAEATFRVPFETHGYLDNLGWYATNAIPGAISWAALIAGLVGMACAVWKRTPPRTLLLLWVPCVVLESCALGVRWNRWVIPALPIILLFATFGVTTGARWCADRIRRPVARRWVFVLAASVALVALAVGPAAATIHLDRISETPSTRVLAARWIEQHVPPRSKIAVEIRGPDLSYTSYRMVEHFALANQGTVADYAAAGYRYLVVNRSIARQFRACTTCPEQDSFYTWLRRHASAVAEFDSHDGPWGGPDLVVYDLGESDARFHDDAKTTNHIELLTMHTTAHSRVDLPGEPIPFVQEQLRSFARDAARHP
jgi:hypothetical protein